MLTSSERQYLDQLAAEIAKTGFAQGDNIEAAIAAAHGKRQVFAAEMLVKKTPRSRMASKALCTSAWHAINTKNSIQQLMRDCTEIAA